MNETTIKLIEKFCEHIDCERNEHGQFIYVSSNGVSFINLPYIIAEYLDWNKSHSNHE